MIKKYKFILVFTPILLNEILNLTFYNIVICIIYSF